jgi:hypothetical protein
MSQIPFPIDEARAIILDEISITRAYHFRLTLRFDVQKEAGASPALLASLQLELQQTQTVLDLYQKRLESLAEGQLL